MAKLNTKIVMLESEQGKDGTNIKSVEKSASDGLTDTPQTSSISWISLAR